MPASRRSAIRTGAAKTSRGHDGLTISRRTCGRGFSYHKNGRLICDPRVINRLARLAVPPAYVDVAYSSDDGAPLQAIGRDAAGRWQYRYHADFLKLRERRKGRHLARLLEALPRIRRHVTALLATRKPTREFAMAAAVALIDASGIRPGTSRHLRLSGARGAVTLLKSNVEITGRSITLAFKAKGGKRVVKDVHAPRVIPAIKFLQRLPGPRLFTYQDQDQVRTIRVRDVNQFLRDVASCKISLKDFRTLRASLNVVKALSRSVRGGSQARRKRQVKQAIQAAADDLANTVTICRKSYIHESVIDAFEKGRLGGEARSNGRPPPARKILAEVVSAASDR
jgi:DNA topoisomerase-1